MHGQAERSCANALVSCEPYKKYAPGAGGFVARTLRIRLFLVYFFENNKGIEMRKLFLIGYFFAFAGLLSFVFFKGPQGVLKTKNVAPDSIVTLSAGDLEIKEFANKLYRQGFDVLGIDTENKNVDIAITGTIESFNLSDKIVSVKKFPTEAPDSRYTNYDTLLAAIEKIASDHPDLVSYFSIGKTIEKRDIWAIRLASKDAANGKEKNTVFFNGMHHAREVMTTEVVLDIARNLTSGYGTDANIKKWLSSVDVFLVPMVNPDGNSRVWSGQPMWRKNVKGGYGVDLNRNYPHKWGQCNGSSGSTYSDTYRGESAGSEPETQAMMQFIKQIKPKYSISYHSYSEIVIYPYSCQGEHIPGADGMSVKEIGTKLAKLHQRDSGNGSYEAGTSWELLYSVDGGDIDWMYAKMGTFPFVVELNSSENGFQPDYSKVEPTLKKTRKGWQYILDLAAN